MSGKQWKGPSIVFVIKDNIRGHENQSAGVAWWLGKLAGAQNFDLEIPGFTGLQRFLLNKILARKLRCGPPEASLKWLKAADTRGIYVLVTEKIASAGVKADEVLFLSTGSSGAPFSLALARATGGKCACIMTPSVLGTEPFDFAIVPEHDFPKPSPNLLVTLGAPNMIREELLKEEGSLLLSRFSCVSEKRWGLLIGGDDANYTIPPSWVEEVLVSLLEEAKDHGADIFMTTSRRTRAETEKRIEKITKGFPNVRMLVLGTRDTWNPVPGMLGLCQRVFCTEDSVSMISEAATAGHTVSVIAVERRNGFKRVLQDITERLAGGGIIPKRFLWGTPRFDEMIHGFCKRGLAVIVSSDPNNVASSVIRKDGRQGDSFNEARRAAEWIIKRWSS